MSTHEISLDVFKKEVGCASSAYLVDLDALINACGASPIHIKYQADKIIVLTGYPERIVLRSGKSLVNISQIHKILCTENGKCRDYTILCGDIDVLQATVKIRQTKKQ